MKNTNGYTINAVTNIVTITKNFANRASNLNSPEYKTLCQLRRDGYFIEHKTVKANADKQTHKGLTIKFMENFIGYQDNVDELLTAFYRIQGIYEKHPAYYAKLKQWFLNQFPDYMDAIYAEQATIELIEKSEAMAKRATKEKANETVDMDESDPAA